MNYWLESCEPPRSDLEDIKWDVFISYRSIDRVWAIALYDMLVQCGYRVFLDQFVLIPGQGLASQLGTNLEASASGVLLWSESTADSEWVKNEIDAMAARKNETKRTASPFFFVVASLDGLKPPGLQNGQLYLDFSEYPDGPMGADLVRLTCGLSGKPLRPEAVRQLVEFDSLTKEEPKKLRAMAKAGLLEEIEGKVKSGEPIYTSSATLSGVAIELLIRGKDYQKAINLAEFSLDRFPNSVRLQQLYGLALRREGRLPKAIYELEVLLEKEHRDTETLGILAAAYADQWEQFNREGAKADAKDALEHSRNLYREAFTKVPTDTYTGINAASKSAFLEEFDQAEALANDVLERLAEAEEQRGGGASPDYWERVTEPEALLIKGNWEKALTLYHEARVAHRHETGSTESTGKQLSRLLHVLNVPDEMSDKLRKEFGLES